MFHALLPLAFSLPAATIDWPWFLGPDRTAVAPALESNFEWGEDGPEILWRQALSKGYGGAAVRDGQVFVLDRETGEGDLLRVFDLERGEELWSDGYEALGRVNFAGSRATPSVHEDLVYVCGPMGHVAAFDRETKSLAWLLDMEEEFEGRQPVFGWSESPVVVGDVVVATPLGADVGLVGLDRKTGEVVWGTESVGFSHSTPALLEFFGERHLVFVSAPARATGLDEPAPSTISGFDPATGELLWRKDLVLGRLPVPPPVQVSEDSFVVTGGYRAGTKRLRIAREGARVTVEEVFAIERGSQTHPPILFEAHLYLTVNENWNHTRRRQAEGGLMCLTLDGKERWRTGADPFLGRGSYVLAGDVLISQDGYDGTLRVIRADPEEFSVIAEAKVFDFDDGRDHEMWGPLALSNGIAVMRGAEELIAVRL